MRLYFNKIKMRLIAAIAVLALGLGQASGIASAVGFGITMSPPNEVVVLNTGEKFTNTITISNDPTNEADFKYNVEVKPFYVDENYNIYYEETEDLNQLVNWITLEKTSGVLPLGGNEKINFTIDVPKDAPAGGQYAAITVTSANDEDSQNTNGGVGVNVQQNIAMAHIIFAEIAGTTRRSGEITDISLPGFMFDGNIAGESVIKNTGNTHGTAKYTLQIWPLFSSEEVYTNEEDPQTKTVLPNRTLYNSTVWNETPAIGIFNAVYTVEFEGVTSQISKLIIKCPVWLLFVVIFIVVAIIIWLVIRIRGHKKAKETED